jgi:hypothetical protein
VFSVRYELKCYTLYVLVQSEKTVPRIRRLASGLSLRKPKFYSGLARVRMTVHNWHWDRFLYGNIHMFACQPHTNKAPYLSASTCCSDRLDRGRNVGTLKKNKAVSEIRE